jgi:N-acetylneuraminic acid mutarotase
MVVWGGFDGAVLNTGARYAPGTDTWATVDPGSAPEPRENHTAVWDGDRLVIFGGDDALGGVFDSGGLYDPVTNTWLPTDAGESDRAAARSRHTAVWTGTKMLVWGGVDAGGAPLKSGSQFDPAGLPGAVWSAMDENNAPPARFGHTAVWDSISARMIVFGGEAEDGSALSDGGIYDPLTDSWSLFPTIQGPTARADFASAWDDARQRLYVFGGEADGVALGGGAGYAAAGAGAWTIPVLRSTGAPSARFDAASVWTGSKLVVFGGFDGSAVWGDGALFTPP